MTGSHGVRYRVGVDVGDRSVGLAAVAVDDDGMPTEVLCAVSHLHDGGMDPSTGKSPQSRLATSGVARRTRRLTRNRRRRMRALDDVLAAHGFPVPDSEVPQTYEAWQARAALTTGYVEQDEQRLADVSLAVRHIARHRGWRNPWWSHERLTQEPSPSAALQATLEAARTRFGVVAGTWSTLGQIAAAAASHTVALRPRTSTRPGTLVRGEAGPVFSHQVRQEDSLAELHAILRTQAVPPETIEAISRAVFHQARPHVPVERVGRDALPGMRDLPRAPRACLEYQEFRVRGTVANLRIRVSPRESRALTPAEHDRVCDRLLGWREPESPRWVDVAEWLDVPVRSLVRPSLDDGGAAVAPVDRTARSIEAHFKGSSQVGAWWAGASRDDRAEFAAFVADTASAGESISDVVAALADEWTAETLEQIEHLALEPGRAAYSRPSLQRLVEVMREQRCDVFQARKVAFGVDDAWQPPGPTFDDPIEHPTVSRVNALVRRFLHTAVDKWGVPEAVIVEHVRSSFMGPTARAEFDRELTANTRRRERTTEDLVKQGVPRPSDRDLRRYECIQRQNGICLYCGTTITMSTSELDHIIAGSLGGSNRRDNLVAVCRHCNSDKGKRPFVVFAGQATRPGITVDEARDRLRAWSRHNLTASQHRRLVRDVARRLGLTEDDEDPADRSIESTAFAAREMRARISEFLTGEATRRGLPLTPTVAVYSGAVTSEARKAGGVDGRLRLRGATAKSRYDRRHHAIDAAVLTTLSPGVAVTLRARSALRRTHLLTGTEPGWKDYQGASPSERARFSTWQTAVTGLTDLLVARVHDDAVPVVRPLRLAPRVGPIHRATIEPLSRKPVSDGFTAEEILRVCDRRIFIALARAADPNRGLPPDPRRAQVLNLPEDACIDLYPTDSAYLRVRGGAAALGDTVQHARIYAWPTRTGFTYGMVRLYSGEFSKIGFNAPGVDIMTAPLPPHSQALRTATPPVRARVLANAARQIGWLTLNDEIEVDPSALTRGDTKIAKFLRAEPETRWVITGFFAADKISLAPAYLAAEGITEDTPPEVADILAANRIPLSANVILQNPGCAIIRRTILGRPRWDGGGHLPASWHPRLAAEHAFST